MQITEVIQRGIEAKLISIDPEFKNVSYRAQNKKYRLSDPEEIVRAGAYIALILDYGYPADRIDVEFPVPHRVPSLTCDIVVFKDTGRKSPFILVECKRPEASKGELDQAVEQGFGYANSLSAEFMWMTSGIRNDYFKVAGFGGMERLENRQPDIPRFGKTESAAFKYTKGGIDGFELEIVHESELTRKFKQAHDALWAGGKRNPAEAFDELDKLIFCKIWDERAPRKPGAPYDFQVFKDDRGGELKSRIHAIYEQGRAKDREVFQDDIRLSNAELQTVVGYLADTNLSETDLDSKGRAFETFMTGFFRGEFGQYFTPRNIVRFIVDALPITNESRVMDTSCGSGGFLLHALDKVRRAADSMADEGYFKKASTQHWKHWHDFAANSLFGIEISEGIARTAKMNMIIHDDGHTNVISQDGLQSIDAMRIATGNQGFMPGTFDYIITNPPFGSKIKLAEKSYLQDYDLGRRDIDWIDAKMNNIRVVQKDIGGGEVIRLSFTDKHRDQQTTEVLFLEQCHRFLRPGGYMAMVIPDSILTNSSMQYVRNWIEEHWRIVSVVSLPQFAFAANGAGVKSSVLFLKKYDAKTTAAIQRIKEQAQDKLHEAEDGGSALERLIAEKKDVLKRGDATCQRIDADMVAKAEALSEQGTLTPALRKALRAEAQAARAAQERTETYEQWKADTGDDYDERIAIMRELLNDRYLAEVKGKLSNYKIYMAITENIGYDAAGRPTSANELEAVSEELCDFIGFVESDDPGTLERMDFALGRQRTFLIDWSDVGTRLDCTYFRARRQFDRKSFRDTERLGRLLKAFYSGGTPLTTNEELWEGDLPWASPKDFDGSFFIEDTIDHISPVALSHSSAKRAEVNTVLMVVRSGVLAHSLPIAVTKRTMAINQDVKAMVPNDRVRADYLATFLSMFSSDILPIITKHGVTVQSVNSPELLSLPIPVPGLDLQRQIALRLIEAHKRRDMLLAQAAAELETAKREIEALLLEGEA